MAKPKPLTEMEDKYTIDRWTVTVWLICYARNGMVLLCESTTHCVLTNL